MKNSPWLPRSPFERLVNCVFLARIMDKARRKAAGRAMAEYMFGDNDYMDSRVLGFLNARAADVLALVRVESDDEIAGRKLVERSGRSPIEVARFSRRMLLLYGTVFAMFDADEGRRTGPFAKILASFYNAAIYPPFAKKFERDEARTKP